MASESRDGESSAAGGRRGGDRNAGGDGARRGSGATGAAGRRECAGWRDLSRAETVAGRRDLGGSSRALPGGKGVVAGPEGADLDADNGDTSERAGAGQPPRQPRPHCASTRTQPSPASLPGSGDVWWPGSVEGDGGSGGRRQGRRSSPERQERRERERERAEVRKPHRLPYSVPPPARPRWRSGVLQGGWWRKEPTVGEGMEVCGIRWRPEDDTARRDEGRWRGGSEASSPLISLSAALPLA